MIMEIVVSGTLVLTMAMAISTAMDIKVKPFYFALVVVAFFASAGLFLATVFLTLVPAYCTIG